MKKQVSYLSYLSLALLMISSILSLPVRLHAQNQQSGKGANLRMVSRLPSKEKRWALIIGVSNYEDGNITPLPGANNDAKALRAALRDYAGFDERQIILLTTEETKDRQPTKNNILRLLGNLSGTVPKDGLLFVAFSGHGIERQNHAFLLASDTPYNDNVRVLERTALSVQNDVKELIRDTGVGQLIILLDARRNDPENGRSSSDNLLTEAYKNGFSFDVRNKEVEAFATLYATSVGERAYEYTREGKGYFTWAFIEGLKGGAANENGEVTLGGMVRYIEKYVPQQVKIDLGSNKIQRPFSIIEGYKAEELVLGIMANNTFSTSTTFAKPETDGVKFLASSAWSKIKTTARTLLKYDLAYSLSENLILGNTGYETVTPKWELLDGTGHKIIPHKFDYVGQFEEDQFSQSSISDSFKEGLLAVNLNNKWGFIDENGRQVIPVKYYNYVGNFSEGLAVARLNSKQGFIDKTGKKVIPFKYEYARGFSEGLAAVRLGSRYGFINKSGEEVVPFKYDDAWEFSGGLAAVKFKDKWGFIDKTGREVVLFKYDQAFPFSEDLALVELNNKHGFIDKTGREVVPLKYDGAIAFYGGLAGIQLNNKWGFIGRKGKEVVLPKYDDIKPFYGGIAQVELNGKYGFIGENGEEWIPPKYESVWCWAFLQEGFIGITLNGKKGFVDIEGNEYFDF